MSDMFQITCSDGCTKGSTVSSHPFMKATLPPHRVWEVTGLLSWALYPGQQWVPMTAGFWECRAFFSICEFYIVLLWELVHDCFLQLLDCDKWPGWFNLQSYRDYNSSKLNLRERLLEIGTWRATGSCWWQTTSEYNNLCHFLWWKLPLRSSFQKDLQTSQCCRKYSAWCW